MLFSVGEAVGWEDTPGRFLGHSFLVWSLQVLVLFHMDSCTQDPIASHPRPHMRGSSHELTCG